VRVHADLFDREAERARVPRERRDLSDVEERLGRNAALVHADSAGRVAVHHDDALSELRRANRGVVPAGSRADDDEVCTFHHDDPPPCTKSTANATTPGSASGRL